MSILYRPPDKTDFDKHFNNVFTETRVLDKQKCYLLGDLNITVLLDEKEIFSNKSYSENGLKPVASNKGLSILPPS